VLGCVSRVSWVLARLRALRFDAWRAMSLKLSAAMKASAMVDTAFIPVSIASWAESFQGDYVERSAIEPLARF
jgi:hypothetical protein